MYFIGQTRFSLYIPNSNTWNVSNFTESEYIDHLFSDDRMSVRAKIFSEVSVPLLNQMRKNYEYWHIVSYSSILPTKWKNLLFDLQCKYPFIYLNEVDTSKEDPIHTLLKSKPNGSVSFFRLDDDDLLSIDYLDYLSLYNKQEFKNMVISFAKGFVGHYENGMFVDLRHCKKQLIAIGQAYIGEYKDGKLYIPKVESHHTLDEFYPIILDSRKSMYIHTHHSEQDTNFRFSKNIASKNFNIHSEMANYTKCKNLNELKSIFPILESNINQIIDDAKYQGHFFEIHNIHLNEKYTTIPIDVNEEKVVFEYEYNFSLPKETVSAKALLIAFHFDREVQVESGLVFSPHNNIGWFKYINAGNGVASGNTSFVLKNPAKLSGIKLVFWDDRFDSGIVNTIKIA